MPQNVIKPSLSLLRRAQEIVGRYAATRERGEQFNLLTIIRRGHLEVMTHSPILAELLRPEGSHGHDATFLQLFLEQVGITDFTPEKATIGEEVNFGELGRIDLVLKDRTGRQIFIENKIGARLQDLQLERYQKADPMAPVLYLTLNGDAPTQTDLSKVPNLRLLSYRDDIVAWLEACRSATPAQSTVHHAITQYRNLVLKLTNQNPNPKMTQELADLALENDESFRAYSTLVRAKSEVFHQLAEGLSKAVRETADDLQLTRVPLGTGIAYDDRFTQHFMFAGSLTLEAELSFELPDFRSCYYGFRLLEGKLSETQHELLCKLFASEFGVNATTNPKWPAWAYWHVRDWDDEVWSRVLNGGLKNFSTEIVDTLRGLKHVGDLFLQQADRAPNKTISTT